MQPYDDPDDAKDDDDNVDDEPVAVSPGPPRAFDPVTYPFVWPENCNKFDPEKVYVHGSLAGNTWGSAIAEVENPTRVCPGFVRTFAITVRPDDGALIAASDEFEYGSESYGGQTVPKRTVVHKHDPFMWDVFHTPACFASANEGWINDEQLEGAWACGDTTLLMRPDTSQLTFKCKGKHYEQGGEELAPGYDVLAHNAEGYSFVRTTAVPYEYGVFRAGNVSKLDEPLKSAPHMTRGRPGGFYVVTRDDDQATTQVLVGNHGSTQVAGRYATFRDHPPGSNYQGVLDAQGNTWHISRDADADVVIRTPLEPGSAEVVYSMNDANPDMSSNPPRAFVDLQFAWLFTGP
jgi:hypothetical protein